MELEKIASEPKVIIKPISSAIEKRYMKLVLEHYKKEHLIKGFFRELYYRARKKI